MHKSQEELSKELLESSKKVEIGATYFHYKNSDSHYKVLSLAITEENDEVSVIYQAQYGNNVTFVRPLKSWLNNVEVDGSSVPRFSKV